jgi:hypothetical protein
VFGERPLRDELKLPVPEPSLLFVLKEIVGLVLVDHTTPLEVTTEPPSELTFPPEVAVVVVMELEDTVLNVGRTTGVLVVNVISFPYPVPALLVAYALT